MTQIRPDSVKFASSIQTYINYDTKTTDIVISGSLADSSSAIFQGTIPYSRAKTRADVYLKNTTTGIKRPTNGGPRQSPYQFVSSEVCEQYTQYNNNSIIVTIVVTNNTGGLINLISQTLQMSAVFYEVPVST